MATSFNELMQKYVNQDYNSLVRMGTQAAASLIPACKKADPDNDGFVMLSSIVLSAIGADGKLSQMEKKFLCDVTGMSQDNVSKYIKLYDSRMEDIVNHFADNLGSDLKANVVMLVCCIAACDETITDEETDLIRKLIQ